MNGFLCVTGENPEKVTLASGQYEENLLARTKRLCLVTSSVPSPKIILYHRELWAPSVMSLAL